MVKLDKSWLCVAIFTISISIYGIANAANNKQTNSKVYVGANYGVGIANKFDYDEELDTVRPKNSRIFGLSLGYKFNDNIRAELAFNRFHKFKYENNDCEKDPEGTVARNHYNQKISSNNLFANFYFDVNKFGQFTPYLNAGFGISKNKAGDFTNFAYEEGGNPGTREVYYKKNSKSKFAWNIGAGIAYNVNNKVSLDLINYKYYNLGQVATEKDEDGDYFKSNLKVHNVSTGIRINL